MGLKRRILDFSIRNLVIVVLDAKEREWSTITSSRGKLKRFLWCIPSI